LLSWTFNKKLGFDSDELESRDRKTATLEPSRLVQSACADFNGSSSYITLTTPIVIKYDIDWEIVFYWTYAGAGDHKVLLGSTSNSSAYVIRTDADNDTLYIWDGGASAPHVNFDDDFIDGNSYKIASSYVASTKIWSVTKTDLSTDVSDTKTVDTTGMGNWTISVDLIGKRGANDRHINGCVWGLNINNIANYPFQKSTYDISGNSNHGTPANITWGTQDSFHRNITEGFDRYLDDATSLVEIDVPYVSGTPVVSSVASYTKQSSHPAREGWHNGAETKWILGATTYDTGDSAWNVDAAVQAVDTEHILHSSSTNYGIAQSYDDMVAEQGEYLFMDVSTANQYKNVLLYNNKQTGTLSVGIHNFVGNRENLVVDANGEYVYENDAPNDYPVWEE